MELEIKVDKNCTKTKIILITSEIDAEVQEIISKIKTADKFLTVFKNNSAKIINPSEIINIYASEKKVFAITKKEIYTLKLRLYELQNILNRSDFVRISNSEIVNLNHVRNFDLSRSGSICVFLDNDSKTFVSRRYISKIKKLLGI